MFGHFAVLFMKGLSVYFWLIYLTFNENNDLHFVNTSFLAATYGDSCKYVGDFASENLFFKTSDLFLYP